MEHTCYDKCEVHLIYGSYSGDVTVLVPHDTDDEVVVARAFKEAGCNFLAMCSQSGRVTRRENRCDCQ